MNRFFVSEANIQGSQVVLDQQQAHQIRNVLRLRPGDRVIVLDDQGRQYDVVLTVTERNKATGRIVQKQPADTEPQVQITLYQSLLARDKFEWVLQKCTEIGVAKFVPVLTQRSLIRHQSRTSADRLNRWCRIITEAAEQCGRGLIPKLEPPVEFETAMSRLDAFDRCLVPTTQKQGTTVREALRHGSSALPETIALFVGPEGGFSEQELQLAQDKGARAVSLGQRILRTETAAIVAASLILYELGDMDA
jgi:16S rRNA (uracil1498-N3)-methyltransferase